MTDAVERHRNSTRTSRSGSKISRLLRRRSASLRNVEMKSFDPDNILPHSTYQPSADLGRPDTYMARETRGVDSPLAGLNNDDGPPQTPSIFGTANGEIDHGREPTAEDTGDSNDEPYDLKAPAPSVSQENIETLASRLLSVDHLNLIIRHAPSFSRFRHFLQEHRPQDLPALQSYLETLKALTAVEYANALAPRIASGRSRDVTVAAVLDENFEAQSRQTCSLLLDESLPAYITHRFVVLVTETLVKEVTGNNPPIMKELVPSLAEVFCITDPSLPDNPIVYASDEFFTTTRYGKDYAMGRNCRFLQGPKTLGSSVRRLVEALQRGTELIETLLNYRRDGSPFMNLLMIAPLYDNKGKVRYYLGCQIDVSALVESGRGLESFAELLKQDRAESRFGSRGKRAARDLLCDLGSMLSDEELGWVRSKTRVRHGIPTTEDLHDSYQFGASRRPLHRLVLGMDGVGEDEDIWPSMEFGRSGRLPGVYRNYMLVRPFPSLRITFTSPTLRIPGLVQSKLMDRIGGPQNIRARVYDALEEGISFTAKISWFTNAGAAKDDATRGTTSDSVDSPSNQGPGPGPSGHGRTRWIHCTPLRGADDRIGVWMIVMVEQEEVTGKLNRSRVEPYRSPRYQPRTSDDTETLPHHETFEEHLRRHRNAETGSQLTTLSARERKEVDDHFRDF